ncbi:MAG: hypothetical protein KDD47_17785, partial [Acidobacteria bacterium]|nr:hypothetical protein [Acidobacteriota bacterium]
EAIRLGARRTPPLLALLALAPLLLPPVQAQIQGGQDFSAQLTATGLDVTGATPGGEVAVFGVWRERHLYWSEAGRVDERIASDGDGGVAWDLGRPIPTATVLFAVDVASGQWRSVRPTALPERRLPPESFALSAEGDALAAEAPALYGWITRPAAGTWAFKVRDGGPQDGLGLQDAVVTFLLSDLETHGDGLAPISSLTDGDLLFALDPESLAAAVLVTSGTSLVDGGMQ